MTTRVLTAALVVLLIVAAGCGQKGDLYLPEEQDRPSEPESRPATS